VRIIIVSGLSGSGKSVALHMLEDLGFYCIDNIPAALLKPFISHTVRSPEPAYDRSGIHCEVLFLLANDDELLRRFAETRRKHPISRDNIGLREAMTMERSLLEPVVYAADLVIDTSRMGVHELRELVHQRVEQRTADRLSITFESFGFKHGIPGDADFVFDARSIPNPYWEPTLRKLTGRDSDVIRFLEEQDAAGRLIEDIATFIDSRIVEYQQSNRGYLTVAVGCTGGQHRSVYIVDRLAQRFAQRFANVTARHSGLPNAQIFQASAAANS
jgi:UPF0042 nucleotide-binding protein